MITCTNLGLVFSDKKLFEDINVKFTAGNCYGVIGGNGAGKSTFLKLLSGLKDSTSGHVSIDKGKRLAFLKQDHFEYEEFKVLDTVIMGHKRLFEIMQEKDALYLKENFSEEDGIKASELEMEFAELDGWNAEVDAEMLLQGLGLSKDLYQKQMKDILGGEKVKVLLAQALFGNPDILLLDEPTNHLDFKAIKWLENFLMDYENTVITVSHDRHFLNKVCTHIFDIDRATGKLYVGNYDFWHQSSKLALRLIKDANKKKEEKIKELEAFVARFSANASKSKQATSRKKALEKIQIDQITPSSRRYPFIGFDIERKPGKELLEVTNLNKTIDGIEVLKNVTFSLNPFDKAVLLGSDLQKTTLLQILSGEMEADSGEIKWGVTVEKGYLPANNDAYFKDNDTNLIDWLREYSSDPHEAFIRGFLGRMLFGGDEPLKKVKVLSGGEKMRCMFSKLMLTNANTLLVDQPTNHLDLESIQAVNEGLIAYKGSIVFTSHDQEFINTIANKVVEITDNGVLAIEMNFEDYLNSDKVQEMLANLNK